MKKIVLILILLITAFIFNDNVYALTNNDIYSNEALLVNMNNDEVLFSKNTSDQAVPIASLTKLMTYAVVIDEISDLENTKIVVPDGLVQEMRNRGASRAGLIDGYEYSALDLLYGMMLPSGCDAAEVLARYIGGGDPSIFVNKMNAKAQELGMNNTLYIDSYGIGTATADNMSTEQDIYKLIKYIYRLPYFQKIISTEYYNITGKHGEQTNVSNVRNTNYLMGEYSGGAYYNPYSIGGKTGTLSVAGKCLVTIAKKGNLLVAAITLGVPNQYGSNYDYNLTDNNKLLNYAFNEYTENITIDIGPEYRSVELGKQHKIDATTSADTNIIWTSADESVATVDQNGIVTAISRGQTKITAKTSTGNIAYTYVSVDFYNGLHTKYSSGTATGDIYEPIDYSFVKNKGIDYVIIRAGYGPTNIDNTFYNNFINAKNNGLNIGIWFEGYAETKEEAENEANNLVSILNNVNVDKSKINLPVFYNLLYSPETDPNKLLLIFNAFKNIMISNGYDVVLELDSDRLLTMNLEGIDISVVDREYLPNLKTSKNINDVQVPFWNYKSNAYMGNFMGTNGQLSLMYMYYKKINTIHKEYIKEEQYNQQEVLYSNSNIVTTNTKKYATQNTKVEEDSTSNDRVTIKSNKTKTKKKSSNEKEVKEEKDNSWIFIAVAITIASLWLIIFGFNKKEEGND